MVKYILADIINGQYRKKASTVKTSQLPLVGNDRFFRFSFLRINKMTKSITPIYAHLVILLMTTRGANLSGIRRIGTITKLSNAKHLEFCK